MTDILAVSITLVAIGIAGCARGAAAATVVTVGELRCEYLRDPLGIDELHPRLTWVINDDRRGARQAAYRVLVASSIDALNQDRGDRWDSGRIESDQSVQ